MGQLAQGPSCHPAFPIAPHGLRADTCRWREVPEFVDAVEHIPDEFRDIHDRTDGEAAACVPNVAILNCWGKMRSWMA